MTQCKQHRRVCCSVVKSGFELSCNSPERVRIDVKCLSAAVRRQAADRLDARSRLLHGSTTSTTMRVAKTGGCFEPEKRAVAMGTCSSRLRAVLMAARCASTGAQV